MRLICTFTRHDARHQRDGQSEWEECRHCGKLLSIPQPQHRTLAFLGIMESDGKRSPREAGGFVDAITTGRDPNGGECTIFWKRID